MQNNWAAIDAASFVSFGTFRKNGALVATPVWIARDGSDYVVTSERATGKVKRLHNNPHVQLQVCDRFGKVAPGAPVFEGSCAIAGANEEEPGAVAAFRKKYRLEYVLITGFEALMRRLQRKPGERVILRITPAVAA
jgi:PPOX class probable F420-dependent enzyme